MHRWLAIICLKKQNSKLLSLIFTSLTFYKTVIIVEGIVIAILSNGLVSSDISNGYYWRMAALCISVWMWISVNVSAPMPTSNGLHHVKSIMSMRCPWCSGYRHRKWKRRLEFKSWTRLIAFHIALIPLRKVWIQLFSLQLRVNSRTD